VFVPSDIQKSPPVVTSFAIIFAVTVVLLHRNAVLPWNEYVPIPPAHASSALIVLKKALKGIGVGVGVGVRVGVGVIVGVGVGVIVGVGVGVGVGPAADLPQKSTGTDICPDGIPASVLTAASSKLICALDATPNSKLMDSPVVDPPKLIGPDAFNGIDYILPFSISISFFNSFIDSTRSATILSYFIPL
jgi:hypothetical protein